jgi:hypothetical protein
VARRFTVVAVRDVDPCELRERNARAADEDERAYALEREERMKEWAE